MDKYSTKDFERDFPTDDACLEWLFTSRWPDGVKCEKCGKITPHHRIHDRACYSCQVCGSHVYPMAGTIFQDKQCIGRCNIGGNSFPTAPQLFI